MRKPGEIPFRIALPAAFLILSLALRALGEAQNLKVRNAGPHYEAPPDVAAARWVDHLINAPAWVPARKMWSVSTRRTTFWSPFLGKFDWWYRLFLVLLWFLIGYRLDRLRRPANISQAEQASWPKFALRLLLALYGVVLLLNAPRTLYVGYFVWANYVSFRTIPVYAWGVVFIFAGLYPVSPARKRAWRLFLGGLVAAVGAFECCFEGYVLYCARHLKHLDLLISPIITIVVFCVSLPIAGILLLARKERRT